MRRIVWVLSGIIVVLVVVLAVVVVTSEDEDSNKAATTTTSPITTTTAPPATTAPPTTAAPPSSTLPLPPITDDPQTYAQYLFIAWQNNDQGAAGNVANAQAVSQMFAQPYKAPWTFANCDPAAGSLYCTWNGQGTTKIVMTVRTLTGGLPIQVLMVQRQG